METVLFGFILIIIIIFFPSICRFVLSAVSPAVVVPTILKLKKEGYGEDKGMSTMIIAASSLDDIVSISAFGILLAILFSEGKKCKKLLH